MKKEIVAIGLVTLLSASVLTACSTSSSKSEAKQETTTKSKKDTEKSSSKKSSTKESSSSSSTKESSATSSSSSEKKEAQSGSTGNFTAKNYADLDNLEFAINGKVYRVGETTLQTLIDDGVPFETNSINNANNNVNSNSLSDTFKIIVGDYWQVQIQTGNFTGSPAAAKDLPIAYLYYPTKRDSTQNVMTFAFPFDLTVDSLKANAGEPTEANHYDGENGYFTDTLDYLYDSSQYYSKGGYSFGFMKGALNNVTIKYVPR